MSDDNADQLEKNKAIVRRMLDAFNTGDLDAVREFIGRDVEERSRFARIVPELRGKPAVQRVQTEIMLEHEAFPDVRFEEELLVAEGDLVVLHWSMTGTNRGAMLGRRATNRRIKTFGTEFVRIKDGKIVEHTDDGAHVLDVLRQLGMLGPTMLRQLEIDA